MSLAAQRRDWDELAELDPYWAICTTPGKRFGGWDTDEFFATGEREIGAVLAEAEPLGVPGARGEALDFGCGLGRLTRAQTESGAMLRAGPSAAGGPSVRFTSPCHRERRRRSAPPG